MNLNSYSQIQIRKILQDYLLFASKNLEILPDNPIVPKYYYRIFFKYMMCSPALIPMLTQFIHLLHSYKGVTIF